MNWLDIVILATVAVVALMGLGMGGISVAVTGAGILAGIALATRLQDDVRPLFSRFIDSGNGAEIAAFAVVLVLALIGAAVVGAVARLILRTLMLGWLNRIAGLGLGVVIAFALGSAVLSTIQGYPVYDMERTIGDSVLGSFLADNFDVVLRGLKFVPSDLGT